MSPMSKYPNLEEHSDSFITNGSPILQRSVFDQSIQENFKTAEAFAVQRYDHNYTNAWLMMINVVFNIQNIVLIYTYLELHSLIRGG